jgi:hypothetical protein
MPVSFTVLLHTSTRANFPFYSHDFDSLLPENFQGLLSCPVIQSEDSWAWQTKAWQPFLHRLLLPAACLRPSAQNYLLFPRKYQTFSCWSLDPNCSCSLSPSLPHPYPNSLLTFISQGQILLKQSHSSSVLLWHLLTWPQTESAGVYL